MKISILLLLLCIACSKPSTTVPPTTTTPPPPTTSGSITYYEMPNWRTDTLVGVFTDFTGFDTIFTYTIISKAFIKHKGLQYYMKVHTTSSTPYVSNAPMYQIELFDGTGNVLHPDNVADFAQAYIYYDTTYKKWIEQPQMLRIGYPPFSNKVIAYTSI